MVRCLSDRLRKNASNLDSWPDLAGEIIGHLADTERRALTFDIDRLLNESAGEQDRIVGAFGWQDRFTTETRDTGSTVLAVLATLLHGNGQ